jgi:RNA-directed DNA polymerase
VNRRCRFIEHIADLSASDGSSVPNVEISKAEVSAFLKDHLGLELSAEKTRITHVTEGYDFLGFTVRREVDAKRGYDELLFYPSKKSVMKLKRKIKDMTKRGTTTASVRDKMKALNYLLGGWTNYFRHSAASRTFSYVNSYAFLRLGKWLHGKTGHRRRAIYKRYYRRDEAGYLTWMEGGVALVKTTYTTKISYKRHAHLPNPYLDSTQPVELPYHLDPYPGKRAWDGSDRYGENWSEARETVRQRDGNRCQLCGSEQRVEVHHIRKHHRHAEHNPARLIALCAACHRQQRDPQSQASRQLARYYLKTGEPDVSKDTSPVCAVRRVVVSLLQAGGMREEIPGLSVYLDVKAEGDKSRLRKRCILEGVVE